VEKIMKPFIKENLDGIKDLLFTGLDFMEKNLSQHLEEYIIINRDTFVKADIPLFLFDEWVIEWRLLNANR
jgi:hypothetical protein